MRKVPGVLAVLALALVLVLIWPGLAAPVVAEEEGRIDITGEFVDSNFKAAVYQAVGKAPGEPIYNTDVAGVQILILWNEQSADRRGLGIKNMAGIEYFTELQELYCSGNGLVSLNLSNNSNLKVLYCRDNALTSLDISKNTALKELDCGYNQLTSLDIRNNTKLERLFCNNNKLTSLEVGKNTALKELDCSENQLDALVVGNNAKLSALWCFGNQLTVLDVGKNVALERFYCSGNRLASLDTSKNTKLEQFHCSNNELTSLDVSKNTALRFLYCEENQLPALDISKNTKLEQLLCGHNELASLDVSNNPLLNDLRCDHNRITSLDVSNTTALKTLICAYNLMSLEPAGLENLSLDDYSFLPQNIAQAIDIADQITDENFKAAVYQALGKEPGLPIYDVEVAGITSLDVSGRGIASLAGIEHFTGLEVLDCSYNLLTELDLSHNVNLRELDCSRNRMLQPPTGIDPLKLDRYVFDPQDVKKPISAIYFIIGGIALLGMAGVASAVLVLKQKKKKAAPGAKDGPAAVPEAAAVREMEAECL